MIKEWNEETLDPENWDKMRALGHRMQDDLMTYLETIREQPNQLPPKEAVNKRWRGRGIQHFQGIHTSIFSKVDQTRPLVRSSRHRFTLRHVNRYDSKRRQHLLPVYVIHNKSSP